MTPRGKGFGWRRTGVDLALHEQALHILDERRHPQHAPRPPLAPQADRGVADGHKFIKSYPLPFCFRRVSRLRRPFCLRRPRRRAGRADQPPSARAASQESSPPCPHHVVSDGK